MIAIGKLRNIKVVYSVYTLVYFMFLSILSVYVSGHVKARICHSVIRHSTVSTHLNSRSPYKSWIYSTLFPQNSFCEMEGFNNSTNLSISFWACARGNSLSLGTPIEFHQSYPDWSVIPLTIRFVLAFVPAEQRVSQFRSPDTFAIILTSACVRRVCALCASEMTGVIRRERMQSWN